jgi:DNA-binding XRE family transcriptional regulator
VKNNIEEYLKTAKFQGKTVTEVIVSSGVGRTSFYEIKSGNQVPKLPTAMNIARALGASLDEIFPELKEGARDD